MTTLSGFTQKLPAGADTAPLRAKWCWIVGLGVVYVIAGFVALGSVMMATVASVFVVGVMMICYLSVPARMVGVTKIKSRRDSLATTAIGGAVGAVVCSPPYMIGRLGILMLGWRYLFWPGVLLIVIGAALQTGVTSAVKAVKFSAKLVGDPTLTASAAEPGAAPAAPQT